MLSVVVVCKIISIPFQYVVIFSNNWLHNILIAYLRIKLSDDLGRSDIVSIDFQISRGDNWLKETNTIASCQCANRR